ncbi:MAG: PAS domain S-box protein, partial [Candidatus Zixiibacteriota bacterium]
MELKKNDTFDVSLLNDLDILDNISEHIIIHDLELKMVWANQAGADSVGLEKSQLIGRHCYEIWHKSDKPCLNCPVTKALKSGKPAQSEIETPDGRIWNIRSYPIINKDSEIIGAVELTQDITARKKAEQALIEREASYRHLFESSMIGWWCTSIEDGTFLKVNKAGLNALGFDNEEEFIGKYKSTDFYSPDERRRMLAMLEESGKMDRFETQITTRDGKVKTALMSARVYPDKGIIEGSVIDITEHKTAVEAFNEAVQKYSKLYENLRDGAVTIDMNGRIIECNPAF